MECEQNPGKIQTKQLESSITKTLFELQNAAKQNRPLIHCLTNSITSNDCANIILAAGGRPIMAEHPEETEEITKGAKALVINTGNITSDRMRAMERSAKIASKMSLPIVIDCVGASCSTLRREFLRRLAQNTNLAILKGNRSELRAMLFDGFRTDGVDAEPQEEYQFAETVWIAKTAANQFHTVTAITGAVDIISDGNTIWLIKNGCPELTFVTGTGCMTGMLMGVALASAKLLPEQIEKKYIFPKAVSAACYSLACFGLCGELAQKTASGIGSFKTGLLDAMYSMTPEKFEKGCKIAMSYE